jgi:hypothetical protein
LAGTVDNSAETMPRFAVTYDRALSRLART